MIGRPEVVGDLDTPEITAGAIQYVECDYCGVKPGDHCRVGWGRNGQGSPIFEFAHIARRMDYMKGTYPAPTLVLTTWTEWRDKQRPVVKKEDDLADLIGKPAKTDDLDDLIGAK